MRRGRSGSQTSEEVKDAVEAFAGFDEVADEEELLAAG